MSASFSATGALSGSPSTDPRLPCDDDCVLPYMLTRRSERRPDETFAIFEDGQAWTNADALRQARVFGAGLRACGLDVGDKVLVWMPNGPLALASWFGINMIGAVFVAINTSYKGKLLEHVIENSGAATMVCHPDLADRLLELPKTSRLRTVFTTPEKTQRDAPGFAAAGFDLRSWDSLLNGAPDISLPVQGLKPWTLQSVCYTSGTTGPSKGVMSSYLHLHTMGFECTAGTDASDRWLINLPLFHAGGTLFVAGAFSRGSSIALLGSFETTSFLRRSRELGATACVLLGAMASFLLRQPPDDGDRDHLLRRVMILPLNEDSRLFRERFGFDVYTVFNMSEISCPIRSDDNPSERGSCGKLRPGVEARIVDEHDCEVAVGDVGELVLRADCPWTMSHGYLANPEATASAWRNGWFHTGDGFRRDHDGNYFFVDSQGCDPAQRREHLFLRSRIGGHEPPFRARSSGRRRSKRVRRGGCPDRRGSEPGCGGDRREPAASSIFENAPFHDPALRAVHGLASEDADCEGRKAQTA